MRILRASLSVWSIGVAAVMLAACGSGESSPLGRVSGVDAIRERASHKPRGNQLPNTPSSST